MASNKFTSLFLTATALILLLASSAAAKDSKPQAVVRINPLCKHSEHKRMCNRMVRGASNYHDASINALKTILASTQKLQKMEPNLKEALVKAPLDVQKEVVKECRADLKQKVADIVASLAAVSSNNPKKAIKKLGYTLHDNCYVQLQISKKLGFEYASPYYKKTYLQLPEFQTVLDLVQSI